MVLQVILIICIIVVAAFIINGIEDHHKGNKMSFREAMDLTELPIVTFYQGNEKFNFLLDTGSNHSHISTEASERIKGTPMTGEVNVSGSGGSVNVTKAIQSELSYKDDVYNVVLLIGDHLNEAFKSMKENTGVSVHGIIGSTFLNENKYVLDFDELVAYTKE